VVLVVIVSHKVIYGGITSNVGGYVTYTYMCGFCSFKGYLLWLMTAEHSKSTYILI